MREGQRRRCKPTLSHGRCIRAALLRGVATQVRGHRHPVEQMQRPVRLIPVEGVVARGEVLIPLRQQDTACTDECPSVADGTPTLWPLEHLDFSHMEQRLARA